MEPKIIIHGGSITDIKNEEQEKEVRLVIEDICIKSWGLGSALDAVVLAVTMMEDHPFFDAGTGSKLQEDGHARMTASIMDSQNKKFAAVINIEQVSNPVQIAYQLLKHKHSVLEGKGAIEFARKHGFKGHITITNERFREWCAGKKNESGTVGAVAIDSNGVIAAATSTGGVGYETAGRVGDAAMPCGNYVNDYVGISCTGIGEDIINIALASTIAARVADGMFLDEAIEQSFKELDRMNGKAGLIAIDKSGMVRYKFNTEGITYGIKDSKGFRSF